MTTTTRVCASLFLAVVASSSLEGWTSGRQDQDPVQEPEESAELDGGTRDIYGRRRIPKPGTNDPLDGAWQLLSLEADGYPQEGIEASGYVLISHGFISLHLQVVWPNAEFGSDLLPGYQSFFAEYTRAGERLTCQTLTGAYLDEDFETLEFESGIPPRIFTATLVGNLMTLEWGSGDSMVFGRRLHSNMRGKSIYGKTLKTPPEEDPDVFGREEEGGSPPEDPEGDGETDDSL